jgi:membrane protease subunit HflC
MNKTSIYFFGALFLVFYILSSGLFIVDQTHQAIVLQFGQIQKVHTTPGLKFKWPLIQDVIFYDRRVLDFDLPPIQVTTGDQKRLVVDTYTRYRIVDPLHFFQTIKPANEAGVRIRLEALISSSVRNVLGKIPLRTMLSAERSANMKQIEEEVKAMVKPLGIEIIDVRIIRTELPVENRPAVFARMNSELDRFAKENRAKGEETAQGIRSRAEKERTILLANAKKISETTRGEADQKALEIMNSAYEKDASFASFWFWTRTYRQSLNDQVSFVLSTDSPILKKLNSDNKKYAPQ